MTARGVARAASLGVALLTMLGASSFSEARAEGRPVTVDRAVARF
jgi:hypothetical protein